MPQLPDLTNQMKHEVLEKVLAATDAKFYKPELLDESWSRAVAAKRTEIEGAPKRKAFEEAVSGLLKELKSSHFGFFHGSAQRASSRAALSATYPALGAFCCPEGGCCILTSCPETLHKIFPATC